MSIIKAEPQCFDVLLFWYYFTRLKMPSYLYINKTNYEHQKLYSILSTNQRESSTYKYNSNDKQTEKTNIHKGFITIVDSNSSTGSSQSNN